MLFFLFLFIEYQHVPVPCVYERATYSVWLWSCLHHSVSNWSVGIVALFYWSPVRRRMIVNLVCELVRVSTIIDYHAPFDRGFKERKYHFLFSLDMSKHKKKIPKILKGIARAISGTLCPIISCRASVKTKHAQIQWRVYGSQYNNLILYFTT